MHTVAMMASDSNELSQPGGATRNAHTPAELTQATEEHEQDVRASTMYVQELHASHSNELCHLGGARSLHMHTRTRTHMHAQLSCRA